MSSRNFTTSFYIAWRYFFSRKGTNAVHVIAIVSVVAIAIVTTVMVVALSVFNGFEGFTTDQFASLSPASEIHKVGGRDFSLSSVALPDDVIGAAVLKSQALAKFEDNARPVTLIGIDSLYRELVPVEERVIGGSFYLGDAENPSAVMGVGVAAQLGAGAGYLSPLTLIIPRRLGRMSTILPQRSFLSRDLNIEGVFQVDQEEDESVIYVPIDLLRQLLMYEGDEVTHIATDCADEKRLQEYVGDDFEVRNIYEQHPEAYRVLEIEKWVTFLLLIFVLILCLFSVISALGLLIVEKREDSEVLLSLGATRGMIDRVLRIESYLLSLSGLLIGLVTGVLLVLSQEAWGWFKMGGDQSLLLIDAYPVELRAIDLLLVTAIILVVGWISSHIAFRLFARR